MTTFPWLDPASNLSDQARLAAKLLKGFEELTRLRVEDVTVGAAAKQVVHRDGAMSLYHYLPRVEAPFRVPVLIIYALFNRYYMLDLQPDRSLVGHLLDRGLDVYLIDWGYPGRGDRWLTLDDHVNGYIDDCVEVVRERGQVDRVNLLGVCQGGVSALCYSALHPEKVATLTTMVAPVDFHAGESLVATWIRAADVDTAVDALGMIPGEMIALGFSMRSVFERNLRKYLDLVEFADDAERLRNFLRMEKWIYDTPDVPGETYRQWIKDFYQDNKLVKGEVELGGRRVDLGSVRMPVLNVYAEHDDFIPPESAAALERYVGTDDYTAHSFRVGHIGMYVSGRAQRELPPVLAGWLRER